MEEDFENAELISLKKNLLNSLSIDKLKNEAQFIRAYLFHGIKLNFFSINEGFANKVLGHLPKNWILPNSTQEEKGLNIYLDTSWNNDWDYETNPNCLLNREGSFETAIQRDFLGIDYISKAVLCLTDTHADGIFNALRWLLPRRMLDDNTFLLHSSCVIDKDKAYFFLGHSGAGKSTVASLSGERIVLGDDMNVMRFDGEKAYAKAGGLGGLSFSNTDYEKEFEVAGFYWLEQSNKTKVSRLSASKGAIKILASLANIFWDNMKTDRRDELLDLALNISSKVRFSQLDFKKDKEFWNHVTFE